MPSFLTRGFQIDPALLEPDYSRAQPPPGVIRTRPDTMDATGAASDSEDDSGNQETARPPPTSSPTKKKRIRITTKNPIYGFVEGARRGQHKFCESLYHRQICHSSHQSAIVRQRRLRPSIAGTAEASKRFHRLITDIISRVSVHYSQT